MITQLRRMLRTEWRYTYVSARRDGYTRRRAGRKLVREVWAGLFELGKP